MNPDSVKHISGGPAFPLPLGEQNIDPSVAGMTLRDYFAAKAVNAVTKMADAMPAERVK